MGALFLLLLLAALLVGGVVYYAGYGLLALGRWSKRHWIENDGIAKVQVLIIWALLASIVYVLSIVVLTQLEYGLWHIVILAGCTMLFALTIVFSKLLVFLWSWRFPVGRSVVALVGVAFLWLSWSVYRSFVPGANFYRDEFVREVGFDLPESAEFLEGEASFPDFKGEYCAFAIFSVDSSHLTLLEKQLAGRSDAGYRSDLCQRELEERLPIPSGTALSWQTRGGFFRVVIAVEEEQLVFENVVW